MKDNGNRTQDGGGARRKVIGSRPPSCQGKDVTVKVAAEKEKVEEKDEAEEKVKVVGAGHRPKALGPATLRRVASADARVKAEEEKASGSQKTISGVIGVVPGVANH